MALKACTYIGIDLGTTNSVASVWNGVENVVIRSYQHGSHTLTPSFVAFDGNDTHVGWPAYAQWERNPTQTVFSAKRLIGRKFNDPVVTATVPKLPFTVCDRDGECGIKLNTTTISPEDVAAFILIELKKMAEENLKCEVTHAVVTVPAYFNARQRDATRRAIHMAGLVDAAIINEPTAAALAYGLNAGTKDKTICIFDLGGGTFDVTVMQVKSDGLFEVLSTGGDSHLGGDDFDERLMQHFLKEWDIPEEALAPCDSQRLRKACKEVKESLADHAEQTMELENFHNGTFEIRITRSKFESLCKDLFKKAINTLNEVLHAASKNVSDIDEVVLVGGSCKMLKVQNDIKKHFGKEPYKNINPDEVVAMGAATRAAQLFREQCTSNGESTKAPEFKVQDVIPHSLGVGLIGDTLSIILPKNTKIPVDGSLTESVTYKTTKDDQKFSSFKIYQGEDPCASKNTAIGLVQVFNLPPAPAGKVSVTLTFSFKEKDGILRSQAVVNGEDNREATVSEIRIEGMTDEEVATPDIINGYIDRLKDDKLRNALIQAVEDKANMIYQNEDVFPEEDRNFALDVIEWMSENRTRALPSMLKNYNTQLEDIIKNIDDDMNV